MMNARFARILVDRPLHKTITGAVKPFERQPFSPSNGDSPVRHALTWSVACFASAFMLLTLIWAAFVRSYYHPFGDEFSLIVNSTRFFHPTPSSWFLSGYSRYFIVYPEWTPPLYDFLRPGANMVYFLDSLLFGSAWNLYLLTSYLAQSGIVALVAYLCITQLMLPVRISLAVAGLSFLSPGFGIESLCAPAFGFDVLAACFVLLGICALLKKHATAAWLCFTIAVFTKETALFAPIAAAFIAYSQEDTDPRAYRFLRSLLFLVPLLAWQVLRWFAFSGRNGVYVTYGHGIVPAVMRRTIVGILRWPTGVPSLRFWTTNDKVGLTIAAASLLVNALFWFVILHFIWRLFRSGSRSPKQQQARRLAMLSLNADPHPFLVIATFCLGSLAMPVLLGLTQRFGAAFYPLLFITLGYIYCFVDSRLYKSAAVIVSVFIGIAGLALNAATIKREIPRLHIMWAMSADYIQKLSRSKAETVFLVDDLSGGFSSPESVKRFAAYTGNVLRVNDLYWDFSCRERPLISIAEITAERLQVVSDVRSSCGVHVFYGAAKLDRERSLLRRTSVGGVEYNLSGVDNTNLHGFEARRMTVTITKASMRSEVLIPDIDSRQYLEIPAE
jgi:hypothetical protein